MHTVSCVRTLSIGPRRHGPRLCMHRARAAKVALRRSRSRERRCPAAASRFPGQRAPFWQLFRVEEQLKSAACRKRATPSPPYSGTCGNAHPAPTPARVPKHRSLADFKPSAPPRLGSSTSVHRYPQPQPPPNPRGYSARCHLLAAKGQWTAHRRHGALEPMLIDEPQPARPSRVVPQRGAVA